MVKSSNRRAPPGAVGPPAVGPAPAGEAPAPAGGALPAAELDLALALVVTAALVDGAEEDEEAELDDEDDAMPAWMDGDADTAAESMIATTAGTLLYKQIVRIDLLGCADQ